MERDPHTGFKVKFNILDYADILPEPPENIEDIINWNKPEKDCKWSRQVSEEITVEFIEKEVTRILRTGVWIFINKQLVWLPPGYYFFLQYFNLSGSPAEFRLKRLKHVYFKIRVRNNARAIGTYTIKNRQDGETSFSMSDALWQCADGNMDFGGIGMQSKTRDTVVMSCWRTFTMGYNGLPQWLKDTLYHDIVSDDKIATKLKFVKQASEGNPGRDIVAAFGSSTHNAFDSMNNMRLCILDEVNKWEECSFYSTFLNYEKFIAPGTSRKGLFDIFSSPADTSGRHSDEAHLFWKGSDPNNLTEYGSTETRVFRYYSNPLEGIEGMYDEFGDADADDIKRSILLRRKSLPKDKVTGEVRAYPLNEMEMFDSFDGQNSTWSNSKGISERMIFLNGRKFKDEVTKEPMNIFGNLDWRDGIIDNPEGIVFRMSDKDHFDLVEARFCFSYLPDPDSPKLQLKWNDKVQEYRLAVPRVIENVIGTDPIDKRYTQGAAKGYSNAAMVNTKFMDFNGSGIVNCPTGIYCCRPQHASIFFEDAIKFCIFAQAPMQLENINSKLIDYFEDRGYMEWLLAKRGEAAGSLRKGDAPSGGGKNAFLNEIIMLVDDATNVPLTEDDPYLLELNWFHDLLESTSKLNKENTQTADLFMAWGQSLLGKVKILKRPKPKNTNYNEAMLSYMFN